MKLPSYKELTNKAISAFNRFPITLTWAIVGTLFFIWLIEVDSNRLFDYYENSLLTFTLGVSWFIGTKFFIEQQKEPQKWQWIKLVTLVLLICFYTHLPETIPYNANPKYYVRFFLYMVAGHLFLFFAPFAFKWSKEAYWNYLKSICIAIGRSILFSAVLYLGLVLALAAMEYLFDFDINGKRYGQLFVFCLGIVNTWTYLSDFPKNIFQENTIKYNKALEVFVKYILIPLVILYIIILYAYAIKILIAWDLPRGWVSNLIIALSFLGFSIQVMVNPVQKTIKSWSINRFYPWFYILLLPLIILLFVAIFKRISDYGITESRYFLLALALWILGITLYVLFSKKKRLKILPISLFIIIVFSSFGFWGAFSVSKNSQVNHFKQLFLKVKETKNLATNDEYNQLKSIIEFLNDRESVSRLDKITGITIEEVIKDTTKSWDNYTMPSNLLDSLGITIDPKDSTGIIEAIENNHYYYSNWNKKETHFISGYDYFKSYRFNEYDESEIASFKIEYLKRSNELWLLSKTDSTKNLVIPLRKTLMALTKYGTNLNDINQDELILEASYQNISAKLIFTELSYYVEKDSVNINSADAYLLLKVN